MILDEAFVAKLCPRLVNGAPAQIGDLSQSLLGWHARTTHSLLGSSLGALLGTEADTHDAADNAANDGAAGEDHTDDDQDNDSHGHASSIVSVKLPLGALAILAVVGFAGPVSSVGRAGLAVAPFAPLVVVAHLLFVVLIKINYKAALLASVS